jgi:antitoxin component of MazEF toxin-antitoxin module
MESDRESLSARMDRILARVPADSSKSERIRRLAKAGFARADIARHVGVRYQFVHNVVSAAGLTPAARSEGDDPSLGEARAAASPVADRGDDDAAAIANGRPPARWYWVEVRPGGGIDLPEGVLDALGCRPGDKIQLSVDGDGVLTVRNRSAALRALREEAAQYIPEGVDLVAELIADRRAEAAKDLGDD